MIQAEGRSFMSRTHQIACHGRKGVAVINFLVALPVVLMIAWLGVEFGLAARAAYQARVAADAISLAAAARFADGVDAAVLDAQAAAANNRGPNGPVSVSIAAGAGGGGDVEFGHWDETSHAFTPDMDGGPAVRVTVRFNQGNANGAPHLVLSRLFSTGPVSIERASVAVYTPPKHITSLLVLGAAAPSLELLDTARLRCRGGVSVHSDAGNAVSVASGALVGASVLRAGGTVDEASRDGIDGAVEEGFDVPEDPFAGVALETFDVDPTDQLVFDSAGVAHLEPGAHASLAVTHGTVVLDPGVHQFAQGVSVTGDGVLGLDGATIQLGSGGTLTLGGSGVLQGTPADQGAWAGHWIVQRGVPVGWSMAGQSRVEVQGICYAPAAAIALQDQAQLASQAAIVRSIGQSGSSRLDLSGWVSALDMPMVAGRARLVR